MRLRATLLVLCTAAIAPCQGDHSDRYLFRVSGTVTPTQWEVLHGQFDCQTCLPPLPGQPFDVMVTAQQMVRFADLGLDARFLGASALDVPPGQDYTTAEIEAEIDAHVAANPAIASKVDITTLPGAVRTHNNNSIYALKVSDNVGSEEDEPAMVFAAQHHAREMNAPHMVVGAMRRVMAAYGTDPALTAVVDSHELYFVPTVNVDGVNHVWCCDDNWRKNRRNNGGGIFGVDLNRNFGFLFGACGASSSTRSITYKGPSANSEPETRTMNALMRYLRPEVYIDFHNYGREVLFLYAPCATVNSRIRTMANWYVNDLRNPMNYATRAAAASGEAPQHHWAEGGAMSLLIEASTSFQPTWTSTVNEEVRVWPGLERVMKVWRPTISGHVRSIMNNEPVEANITYTPNLFNHGEKSIARPRDGRYVVFTPQNSTFQVTYSAAGYQPVTKTVTVGGYNQTTLVDVELIPSGISPATLTKSGSEQIGGTTTLTYNSPGDAGDGYWVALSTGDMPGIQIATRTIPLNADGLLFASATPNAILMNNVGIIPGSNTVIATFPVPPIPTLVGITLYTAGLTLNTNFNFNVKKFSPAVAITIQP